jgi:hypothetical protein
MGEEARRQPRIVTATLRLGCGGSRGTRQQRRQCPARVPLPALAFALFSIRSPAQTKGAVSPLSALTVWMRRRLQCVVKFDARYADDDIDAERRLPQVKKELVKKVPGSAISSGETSPTRAPNFARACHSASEKIVENGTTYIIQHGRRYDADPPHTFIGVEPGGMHPSESDPEKVKALCAEYDVVYS